MNVCIEKSLILASKHLEILVYHFKEVVKPPEGSGKVVGFDSNYSTLFTESLTAQQLLFCLRALVLP